MGKDKFNAFFEGKEFINEEKVSSISSRESFLNLSHCNNLKFLEVTHKNMDSFEGLFALLRMRFFIFYYNY